MAFLDKAIALMEEIDAAPEKKQWCREYSVYSRNPGQEDLERRLNAFMDESYINGLVITNYVQALELYGLQEPFTKIDQMPYLAVLACVAWHFRRDHFSEGSLIRESIANRELLQLLRRLKEAQPGDRFATTLMTAKCYCDETVIPDEPGIYRVLAPAGFEIQFTDSFNNTAAPLYPPELLAQKYEGCTNREILYIGKANGKHGLYQRVKQYMNYGYRHTGNHKGGRAIWQIKDAGMLLLDFMPCADCEEREHQLLRHYKGENGCYPLANWRG